MIEVERSVDALEVLGLLHLVLEEAEGGAGPRLGEHEERVLVVGREVVHALELGEAGECGVVRNLVVTDGVDGGGRLARRLDLTVEKDLLDAAAGSEGERAREGE